MPCEYVEREFDKLAATVNKLHFYKMNAERVFLERDAAIRQFYEQLPEWAKRKEGTSYFLHYQSPSNGDELLVRPTHLTQEEEYEHNVLQQLKTYHWLLADAYEAFEDFLMSAYAYCGLEGLCIWIRPKKNWARDGSRRIEDYETGRAPYDQIQALRRTSPHFATHETVNATGTNYRVVFVLIEKMRHAIVHNEGYCDDIKLLMDKVQGLVAGEDIKTVRGYIESHFMAHKGSNLVDLLEYPAEDEDGNPSIGHHDQMTGFFRVLVEYGYLIKEAVEICSEQKAADIG